MRKVNIVIGRRREKGSGRRERDEKGWRVRRGGKGVGKKSLDRNGR